jgi:hypothetical protein
MLSPRTPSAQSLVAGSLFAATFVFLAALIASSSTSACKTADTTPAPDAAEPPCNSGPFAFCEIAPPGQPACNTDEGTSTWLTRLPRGTNYPVGCVVNFVGARDEQGDCRLDAVCKCILGERTVPPGPLPEAGPPIDAGEDAEAGTAPLPEAGPVPAPVTETVPMWNCSP